MMPSMSNLSLCEPSDHFNSMVVPDSDQIMSPIQNKNELDELSMQVNHNKKLIRGSNNK